MEKSNLNIGIIGHFGEKESFIDGQTVKTKEVEKILNKKMNKHCNVFDTYKNSKNPFKLIMGIKRILKQNDVVIFLLSTRGYGIILPILIFFNRFYKRKIFDFVIGSRFEIYKKNQFIKKLAQKIDKIYVETSNLKTRYKEIGINNVDILPNFKEINIYPKLPGYREKDILKICFFSRICKEKGIEDAIKAIEYANKKLKKEALYLDIYGQVDKKYESKFEELKKDFPKFINYKGIINPNDSSNTIKDYDILLFLTYWEGECFPGTVIDSLAAGVPLIATEWNSNFEILKNDYTAFSIQINEPKMVGDLLIECYNNQRKIYLLKQNCIKESYKYLPNNVIGKFLENL